MPTRTLTAPQSGPVLIDAQLLGAGGVVTVRTDPGRMAAEITIRTTDETGDSADAVRDADLRWDTRDGALVAHVQGKGGTTIVGGGVFIGGTNVSFVQNVHTNYGSTVVISGGDLNFSGRGRAVVAPPASAIEIIAVVPEGSSVTARTRTASVIADGEYAAVTATTQSGDVRVPRRAGRATAATQSGDVAIADAPHLKARTESGSIRLGCTNIAEAHTMSGDIAIGDFGGTAQLQTISGGIRVHATVGGCLTASTMSGDIEVTATDHALEAGLDVRANTMSGGVDIPRRQNRTSGPRRRRD